LCKTEHSINVPTQFLCTYTSDDEPHGAKIVASDKMGYLFANNCKIVVMCDAERTGEASTIENFVNLRVWSSKDILRHSEC
jgi:aspartokinase-like uncharacterized kinase